jgi:hypothetical protein
MRKMLLMPLPHRLEVDEDKEEIGDEEEVEGADEVEVGPGIMGNGPTLRRTIEKYCLR